MAAVHREAIQKQIQQDWANREYIDVITGSIKKITDFLNSFGKDCSIWRLFRETDFFFRADFQPIPYLSLFNISSFAFYPADMSCRSRLAVLNEKLTTLERRIEYLEARVSPVVSQSFSNLLFPLS